MGSAKWHFSVVMDLFLAIGELGAHSILFPYYLFVLFYDLWMHCTKTYSHNPSITCYSIIALREILRCVYGHRGKWFVLGFVKFLFIYFSFCLFVRYLSNFDTTTVHSTKHYYYSPKMILNSRAQRTLLFM